MDDKIIAVTGATGLQGGAVARKLLADGWKVRALTRDPNKPAAQELASRGAEIVPGDMEAPSNWILLSTARTGSSAFRTSGSKALALKARSARERM